MRLSVGAACAVLAILVELGLDRVVAVAPWLIVAFAFGLVAAVLGGWLGGLVAAVASVLTQALLIPVWVPEVTRIDGVGWPVDVGASLAALLVGSWIRGLLLGPRAASIAAPAAGWVDGIDERRGPPDHGAPRPSSPAAARGVAPAAPDAPRGSGGSAGSAGGPADRAGLPDPRRAVAPLSPPGDGARGRGRPDPDLVAAAVRDIGTARTPAQVADALARHAAALAGADGAVVYLGRDGADGYAALGQSGVIGSSLPERLPDRAAAPPDGRSGTTVGGAPTPPAGSAGSTATPLGGGVLEYRIGRGSTTHGFLRLVSSADGEPPRPGPLVEVVVLVAADALERSLVQAARRAAEAEAAGAVGRVAILARLAAELVGAATVEEVARTLVDLAVDDLAAGFAIVHVPDAATGAFRLVHARGYPAGLVAGERTIDPSASVPVNRAASDHAIVEVAGEDGWRAAFPSASNVPAITGVRAISAIPMGAGEAVHGVLTIGWRTAADRARVDRDLLATAADQGAQALERAILHAQDEDARRFQEAFIGVVSHELRTPITTILAGSRLLRRRLDGDPGAMELSDDIEVEADRLSRIVDDLLVLSRLERRHLTIADEPVHLDHLLTRIVRSESARWPDHRIVIPPSARRHVVVGDETYVEQVLRNLVSNAAKYSPAGSLVEVAVDDAPDGDVHVRVLDEGPGVAPSEVDELFSLFYRSPTTAASAAGAGIGLFVSRRLVAEMGGRMWAKPRPDRGSEFGFSLTTYPTDEGDEGDEDESPPVDPTAAAAG